MENDKKLSPKQALACVMAIGTILICIGINNNQRIDAAIRSCPDTTLGTVTGPIHRRRYLSRGVRAEYWYDADVYYYVDYEKYKCKVKDENRSGADPYFSVGDKVTVNYNPSEPQYGVVLYKNALLTKKYYMHIFGAVWIGLGIFNALLSLNKQKDIAKEY